MTARVLAAYTIGAGGGGGGFFTHTQPRLPYEGGSQSQSHFNFNLCVLGLGDLPLVHERTLKPPPTHTHSHTHSGLTCFFILLCIVVRSKPCGSCFKDRKRASAVPAVLHATTTLTYLTSSQAALLRGHTGARQARAFSSSLPSHQPGLSDSLHFDPTPTVLQTPEIWQPQPPFKPFFACASKAWGC